MGAQWLEALAMTWCYHWLAWEYSPRYRAWWAALRLRLVPDRTRLTGRLAADVAAVLRAEGL